MMKNIKLNITKITILFLIVFVPINVKADGFFGYGGGSPYTGPTGGGGSSYSDGTHYVYTPIGNAYGCSVVYASCEPQTGLYGEYFKPDWKLYDISNNDITEQTKSKGKILAGTHLGVNLFEYRSIKWWAYGKESTTLSCKQLVQKPITVTRCSNYCEPGKSCYTTCGEVTTYITVEVAITLGGSGWSQSCQDKAEKEGYKKAVEFLNNKEASYTLNIPDPNEARCANQEKYREELKNYQCQNYSNIIADNSESAKLSENEEKTVEKYTYYKMSGACINVKTANVKYLSGNDTCEKDEIYIKNDDTDNNKHWHVFTPLNTKSTENYAISLNPKSLDESDAESEDMCLDILERYKENYEYTLYIRPRSASKYEKNINSTKKIIEKEKGCYKQTILEISVVQKFYNEVPEDETNSSLIGFDFYYRPIDVNNPFPNGVADDSYWKAWSDSSIKTPDLTESFDELSYVAYNINLDSVRDYNRDNLYTSWKEMDIDGTSGYIDNEGVILRSPNASKTSIYNLGCGPSNADWEECKQ